MTLEVGSVGIDYSGARPDHAEIRHNGGRFVVRYSAGAGKKSQSTQWKLCEPHELQQATEAGLDFVANSEWYESRITEGAAAGAADGGADLAFWHSRGLAPGASIYVSWDEAPAQSKLSAVAEYLRAYDAALEGEYHVDCYAGTPALRWLKQHRIIRYGWRPNAGSWSSDGLPYQPSNQGSGELEQAISATPAHVWQTGNYWFGKNADENIVLRTPVGSHLDAGSDGKGAGRPGSPGYPPGLTATQKFAVDLIRTVMLGGAHGSVKDDEFGQLTPAMGVLERLDRIEKQLKL